jgi:uncharacterized membrane protein
MFGVTLTPIFKVLLISMLPVGELRVALPLALTIYKMDLISAFLITVIGNMIPVVFIAYLLEPVSNFLMKHSKFFKWFFDKLFQHTRQKHSKKFEVFEEVALVTFVAIPLPMTGGWSGALAAFVFGIKPKKSIPLIFLGVLGAGIIVSLITLGAKAVF